MSSERKVPGVECQLQVTLCVVVLVTAALHTWYTTEWSVCMSGRAPIQSGRCWFVCPAEVQYNQADVCLYVRTSCNTIRQKRIRILGGKCNRRSPIQSGQRVNARATYNQARQVYNMQSRAGVVRGYIHVPVMKQKKFYGIK